MNEDNNTYKTYERIMQIAEKYPLIMEMVMVVTIVMISVPAIYLMEEIKGIPFQPNLNLANVFITLLFFLILCWFLFCGNIIVMFFFSLGGPIFSLAVALILIYGFSFKFWNLCAGVFIGYSLLLFFNFVMSKMYKNNEQ